MERETYWCSKCHQIFPLSELKPNPSGMVALHYQTMRVITKEGIIEVEDKGLVCPFHYDETIRLRESSGTFI